MADVQGLLLVHCQLSVSNPAFLPCSCSISAGGVAACEFYEGQLGITDILYWCQVMSLRVRFLFVPWCGRLRWLEDCGLKYTSNDCHVGVTIIFMLWPCCAAWAAYWPTGSSTCSENLVFCLDRSSHSFPLQSMNHTTYGLLAANQSQLGLFTSKKLDHSGEFHQFFQLTCLILCSLLTLQSSDQWQRLDETQANKVCVW